MENFPQHHSKQHSKHHFKQILSDNKAAGMDDFTTTVPFGEIEVAALFSPG